MSDPTPLTVPPTHHHSHSSSVSTDAPVLFHYDDDEGNVTITAMEEGSNTSAVTISQIDLTQLPLPALDDEQYASGAAASTAVASPWQPPFAPSTSPSYTLPTHSGLPGPSPSDLMGSPSMPVAVPAPAPAPTDSEYDLRRASVTSSDRVRFGVSSGPAPPRDGHSILTPQFMHSRTILDSTRVTSPPKNNRYFDSGNPTDAQEPLLENNKNNTTERYTAVSSAPGTPGVRKSSPHKYSHSSPEEHKKSSSHRATAGSQENSSTGSSNSSSRLDRVVAGDSPLVNRSVAITCFVLLLAGIGYGQQITPIR